jgi:uncharacterized protein
MQISLDTDATTFGIYAYRPGEVTVGVPVAANDGIPRAPQREVLTRSLIIMPERLISDWPPQSCDELSAAHFATLIDYGLEILLLGSGHRLRWPERHVLRPLWDRNIGVEVMDTGAACRTYNILRADGRKVAAALLID